MVRTSVTVPSEPTGAAKPQGDRPKSARSTNPQYQCGFRANREETKHRSRDALHRPPSWAYSIENTGITGERNPFRQVPRVTPSALRSGSAIRASASRAVADMGWETGADVSRTEGHVEEAQKVTPWKNHLVETKPPTGFFARPPVSPCNAIPNPSRAALWPSPKRGIFRVRFPSSPADAIHLHEWRLPARIATSARLEGSTSGHVAGFHLKIGRPRRARASQTRERQLPRIPRDARRLPRSVSCVIGGSAR